MIIVIEFIRKYCSLDNLVKLIFPASRIISFEKSCSVLKQVSRALRRDTLMLEWLRSERRVNVLPIVLSQKCPHGGNENASFTMLILIGRGQINEQSGR